MTTAPGLVANTVATYDPTRKPIKAADRKLSQARQQVADELKRHAKKVAEPHKPYTPPRNPRIAGARSMPKKKSPPKRATPKKVKPKPVPADFDEQALRVMLRDIFDKLETMTTQLNDIERKIT